MSRLKELSFTVKANMGDFEMLLQRAKQKREEFQSALDEIAAFKLQIKVEPQRDDPDGQETG